MQSGECVVLIELVIIATTAHIFLPYIDDTKVTLHQNLQDM